MDVAQDIHLIIPIVRSYISAGAQLPNLVDVESVGLIFRLLDNDVGMIVLHNEAAVAAFPAGALRHIRLLTEHRRGHHPRKGGLAAAVLPFQKDSMRQTPVSYKIDERLLRLIVLIKLI